MATIDLGKIRFNWQGAYNNSTAYVINDVVSSGGNSYICKLASTGNAVSNGTYWDLMSQAGTNGTNGTDVGTVITTQGDILYRDGSGLQRLAKGTASQQLAMNSSANAPEWITAGGGGSWTLLQSTVLTNQTSVDITGLDNSTYGMFAVVMIGAETGSSAGQFGLRMGDSSGFKTSGYFWGVLRHTCSSTTVDAQNSTSDSYIKMNRLDSQRRSTAVLFVNCEGYHVGAPYGRPTCSGTYVQDDTTATTGGSLIGGTNVNGLDLDRLSVMTTATSFAKGRISFYGIAQS